VRWLLLKDLRILRRSPLLVTLLVLYPIVIAVLIGFALSRGPDKPAVAFYNGLPDSASRIKLGGQVIDLRSEGRRIFDEIDAVPVDSPEAAKQKVRDGDVLAALIIPRDLGTKLQSTLQPATIDVYYNAEDPAKQQFVENTLEAQVQRANSALTKRVAAEALDLLRLISDGGTYSFLGQDLNVLGLQRSEQILDSISGSLPPAQRDRVAQVTRFARLARQNLALANQLLSSIRQPIAVDKQVISGSIPPLDTFAVAVAAAVTLLFVTVLLVSGSLALEREENTFTRLTRGLVSREGLLVEKAILGTGAALVVTLLMLLAITPFQSIEWGRIYAIVPAILLAGAASSGLGLAIGAAAREVRASALLAFALALPVAFISLVPSGTVSKTLLDVIHVIAGAFPFRPALDALSGALSSSGPSLALPFLHLALLTVAYLILARLALRRFT
jgi:ABC-type multidrug transport system permease subunit